MSLFLTAAVDDDGRRLDRILRKSLHDLPLSAIHRLLRQGAVLVDGKAAGAAYRVRKGQSITVDLTEGFTPTTKYGYVCKANPEKLEILFEGEGILAINKAAGIPVHGGINRQNLESLVCSYLKNKIPPSLSFKPGPLHRLDLPSSGVLVFSSSLEGAKLFSFLMHSRKIKKTYLTLVEGNIKKNDVWQDNLYRDKERKKTITSQDKKSKTAVTKVIPVTGNEECSLIIAEIITGRTHQIRAQASSRGHPLLGDKKYGAKLRQKSSGIFLHAWRLSIAHPLPLLIEAPLPEAFKLKIVELFGHNPLNS